MWDICVGGVVDEWRDVRPRPPNASSPRRLGIDDAALEPIGAGRDEDDAVRAIGALLPGGARRPISVRRR
jgi:hypothetical protein